LGYATGVAQMREVIDLLPDARLHVLSGCGHWTMIEHTAEW
jgi:pimeloyl-ACP methyl ester carboxylesterase